MVGFFAILNSFDFLDTPEQAAMTVKQLRATPFPRFGEPLQIMFSLPQYGAPVLLKSFEIFHNEVRFVGSIYNLVSVPNGKNEARSKR